MLTAVATVADLSSKGELTPPREWTRAGLADGVLLR
jgi:hypothetical protein